MQTEIDTSPFSFIILRSLVRFSNLLAPRTRCLTALFIEYWVSCKVLKHPPRRAELGWDGLGWAVDVQ